VEHHAHGPTGPGSVILELGEHIGALILEAPPGLAGREIEISHSVGGPRTHSLVRERVTAAGVSYAAVYPAVQAGEYTVWREDGIPTRPGRRSRRPGGGVAAAARPSWAAVAASPRTSAGQVGQDARCRSKRARSAPSIASIAYAPASACGLRKPGILTSAPPDSPVAA